jgi:hypothetical protein
LVAAKMVPAVSDVWRRQPLHWNSWRALIALWRRSPQTGHSKPSGQRQRARGFAAGLFGAGVPFELGFAEPFLELH